MKTRVLYPSSHLILENKHCWCIQRPGALAGWQVTTAHVDVTLEEEGHSIVTYLFSLLYIQPSGLFWWKLPFLKIVFLSTSMYIFKDPWILYHRYKPLSKLHTRMVTCLLEKFSCMFYKIRKCPKWTWFTIPCPPSYSCSCSRHVHITQCIQRAGQDLSDPVVERQPQNFSDWRRQFIACLCE